MKFAVILSALIAFVVCNSLVAPQKSLIQVAPESEPVWVTEEEKLFLMKLGVGFFDVTETPKLHEGEAPSTKMAFPSGPTHQSEVLKFIEEIQLENLKADLTELSQNFFTRYYLTQTGVSASDFLYAKALNYANNRSDITVSRFTHARFSQKSLIARFQGKNTNGPTVIIGAHLDSINVNNPSGGRSPGADDDGTGTVTVLEVFRLLAEGGFVPQLPLEFQLYAGEEAGLLGSQDIAQSYKNSGKAVYGMFQLDMTGYTDGKTNVRVLGDFVDSGLTAFTKTIINEYTTLKYRDYTCGYACSDHASWYRAGYASATTFEPLTNPRIHSTTDDLNLINWDQVLEFIKLTVGVAIELTYGSK